MSSNATFDTTRALAMTADLATLRQAVRSLEHPGFAARLDECQLEPITVEVVASAKENPMTLESDSLREELRAWMKSPSIGPPEYSADPVVQRRVGRMLANFDAKFAPHAKRKLVVNSIQIHPSDKA